MPLYRFCDLTIAGDESLPLARASDENSVDIRLQRVGHEELRPASTKLEAEKWIHQWREGDGAVSLSIGKRGSNYLLEHPDVALVEISGDGKDVRYAPYPDAPQEYVLTALLNQTLPRILALEGRLALHASAVVKMGVNKGNLLIFAGESGAGKTTMARGLAGLGLEGVADDCILLAEAGDGTVLGTPSYPGIDTEKNGWSLGASDPMPVGAVYQLCGQPEEQCREPGVRPLSARETVMLLTRGMFVLDPESEGQLRVLFKQASRLGSLLEAFELSFPWSETQTPRLLDAVLQHAEEMATG